MDAKARKFTLWALSWPVFIELFLQFLLGTADTLMVSRISDDAVAVVGISNQLFNAVTILFMTVAGGAGVLIAQRLGARKEGEARTIAVMALNAAAVIGLMLSVALSTMSHQIAKWLQLSDPLLPMASIYISIVGGGMALTAVMSTMSTVIRNTGNTKAPMYTAIGMNVFHVTLNYALIFGAFGFPQWGLAGVAVSTVISRLLASGVLFLIFKNTFEQKLSLRDWRLFDIKLFKEVLRIGWPMGIQMGNWVFSQLLIYAFVAMLGTKELAARTYMNTLESFCFMLGYSVALAVQIQIAHYYGARRTQEAYKSAYRAVRIGLVVVIFNALLLFVFGSHFLRLFTSDPEIVAIGVSLLALNLVLQPGKMFNMALGNALTAVGDTRFMMVISLCGMWVIGSLGAYLMGIHAGWGVVGVYIAMIADEYIRGIAVHIRWKGRKFLSKAERSKPSPVCASGGQKLNAASQ